MSDKVQVGKRMGLPAAIHISLLHRSWLFLIAASVVLIDHFTKRIVEFSLPPNQFWAPFPALAELFRFTHVFNTGAAFGIFAEGGFVFSLVAILVAGVIVIYNFTIPPNQLLLRTALGLQLGGAVGNLIDRLRLGHVTDFLDFGPWPVFNLADSAIVAGVVVLGYLMWQEEREAKAPLPDTGERS